MSPRRKIQPGEGPLLVEQVTEPSKRWRLLPQRPWKRPRQWGLPLVVSAAGVVSVGAISVCTLMLISHDSEEQDTRNDRVALSYVRSFMTEFTSLDPFHANDYVAHVMAQATGEFASQYQDKENEILLQVARAEPTKGTVLDAGVAGWNDDGSVNVLVATEVTSRSPDGKQVFENTNRWVATAKQEGNQWKISNLRQVI